MSELPGLDAHPGRSLTPNPKAGTDTPILPPTERGAGAGSEVSHQPRAPRGRWPHHGGDATVATVQS